MTLGTKALPVDQADPGQLRGLDLLVIGSPTRGFRPTASISKLLNGLPKNHLAGVHIAAFDTRIVLETINSKALRFLVDKGGYAASTIARTLGKKGGRLAAPPEVFFLSLASRGRSKTVNLNALRIGRAGWYRNDVEKPPFLRDLWHGQPESGALWPAGLASNPQILTDSFLTHVYRFPSDASFAFTYLAALFRLLGFFNVLVGSLGLWLLWHHRLNPQPWLGRTVMLVPLLAYLAPVIFDNTVGHIGFFEIVEHIVLAVMFAEVIFHVVKKEG